MEGLKGKNNSLIFNNVLNNDIKNILFIDGNLYDSENFFNATNLNTFPIIYNINSEQKEFLSLLESKNGVIDRIGFVFNGGQLPYVNFIEQNNFFNLSDLDENTQDYSPNCKFIVELIKNYKVKNIDFLACESLVHTSWVDFFKLLEIKTGVIVGASNNNTGNIKYGGDWIMESTGEDIEKIYWTSEISNYANKLDTTQITLNGGTIYLKQTNSTSVIQYSTNNSSWISLGANWPLKIINSNPSANNILTVLLNSDLVISNATIGNYNNAYLIIGSEYIKVAGSNKKIFYNFLHDNKYTYPGFIRNGTGSVANNVGTSNNDGFSNITVENLSLERINNDDPFVSQHLNGSGWLCHSFYGKNKTNIVVNNVHIKLHVASSSGGIFGMFSSGTANNCSYQGGSLNYYSGGIFGASSIGTANKCWCYNTIYNSTNILDNAGGIFGSECSGSANSCYAISCNIVGGSGGIFGSKASGTSVSSNCYCICTLGDNSGGIFGNTSNGSSANNCYSICTINSGHDFNSGGIFGFNSNGSITNCYTTIDKTYASATGKTINVTNSFAQNGAWNDINASTYLTGAPTYDNVSKEVKTQGNIWIDSDNTSLLSTPFILAGFDILNSQSDPIILIQPTNLIETLNTTVRINTSVICQKSSTEPLYKWYSNISNSYDDSVIIDGENKNYLDINFSEQTQNLFYYLEIFGLNSTIKSNIIQIIAGQEPNVSSLDLPTGKIYGDPREFSFNIPSSDSPGGWSFTSSNRNVATITSSSIKIIGAGTTTIYATQSSIQTDTTSYTSKTISAQFIIGKKTITVSANNKPMIFGSSLPVFDYTVSGLAYSESASSILTGGLTTTALTSSNIGSYNITRGSLVINTSNNNYLLGSFTNGILSITPKELTITANSKQMAYGDTLPTLDYTVSGLVNSNTVAQVLSGSLLTTASSTSNVGTYPITKNTLNTLTSNNNYTITFIAGSVTIAKRDITIIADDITMVYGSTRPTLTYQVSGLVNSNTPAGVLQGLLSSTGNNLSNTGTYPIEKNTLVLKTNSNYNILSFTNGTLTITKKTLTVIPNNKIITYGNTTPTLDYSVSGLVNSNIATNVLSGTLSLSITSLNNSLILNVGIYKILIGTLVSNDNYNLVFTNGKTVTVNKKDITVNVNSKTINYGDTIPLLDFSVGQNDLANGDLIQNVFYGSLTITTTLYNTGIYNIEQGSLTTNPNYNIMVYNNNTLTINKKKITVTANNKTMNYGDLIPELDFTVDTGDLVGLDTIQSVFSNSLSTNATSLSNIGNYQIVINNLTPNSNYEIKTFNEGILQITQRQLTITPINRTITYGTLIPVLSYNTTGLVNSDNLTGSLEIVPINSSNSFNGIYYNVDTYDILQGTLNSNQNYKLDFDNTKKLTIVAKPIAVSAVVKSITYGNPISFLNFTVNTGGLVSPDSIDLNSNYYVFSGALTTTGTSTSNPGTYPITQGSLLAKNYSITFTQRNLTITKEQSQIGTFTIDNKFFSNLEFTPILPIIIKGNQQIQYTSLNTSVAIVSSTGKIKMMSDGVVTITATLPANTQYLSSVTSATFTILRAESLIDDIFINNQIITQNQDQSYNQLIVYPNLPKIKIGDGTIVYYSDNLSVAEINENTGTIIIKGIGTVTITATLHANSKYSESTKSTTFTVVGILDTDIPNYLETGANLQLLRQTFISKIFDDNQLITSFDINKLKLGFTNGTENIHVEKQGTTINISNLINENISLYVNLFAENQYSILNFGTTNLVVNRVTENKYTTNFTGNTMYNYGDQIKIFNLNLEFGGLIQNTFNLLEKSGGTIFLRQSNSSSFIECKIDGENWISLSTNWPIQIKNNSTTNILTVELTSNITISSTTIGEKNNGFLDVASSKIKIDGKNFIVSIDGISNYKGFVRNGTGINNSQNTDRYSNIEITNLGIVSYGSTLNNTNQQGAGWLTHSYWGDNTCSITNCFSNGPIGVGCGGILGYMSSANVIDCYSVGSIGKDAGGIFGPASTGSTVSSSFSVGSIGENAGGIYGSISTGSASNCYSLGIIGTNAGGIFGKDSTFVLSNCYSANGTWITSNAVSLTGTNHLDTITTPTYNQNGTVLNLIGSKWICGEIFPYIQSTYQSILYSSNSQTLNYGISGNSDSGLFLGKTYLLVNNINGISIDSTSGVLSFSNSVNAGTYKLVILYYDTINLSYTYGTYDLTINKIPITVTPNTLNIEYGSDIPELTYNVNGLINGQDASSVFSGSLSTEANNSSSVNTYLIKIGSLTCTNYTISLAEINLTIYPKTLYITPNDTTINYGDDLPTITYTTSGFVNNDTNGIITGKLGSNITKETSVGSYLITIGTLNAPNYNINLTSKNLVIQPKPVNVTPDDVIIKYGELIPDILSFTTTELANGQTKSIISGNLSSTATNSSPIGNYPITGSLTAPNYSITLIPKNIIIQPRPITITASSQTKKYTGTVQNLGSTSFTTSGILPTQSIQSVVLNSSGLIVSETPYIINISNAISDSNTLLSNYNITYQTGTLLIEKSMPVVGPFKIDNKVFTNEQITIIHPTKPNDNTGTWSYISSDTSIATISQNNDKINLISTGTVKITAILSSDNNYNSVSLITYFTITQEGIAPSDFTFVGSDEILLNIPVGVESNNGIVEIPNTILNNSNFVTNCNPTTGTNKEKIFNKSLIVKTLFDYYSNATTIVVPKNIIYLSSEIKTSISNVKLFNSLSSSFTNPKLINATGISSVEALYCLMDIGNSVLLNGTGKFSNDSIQITKNQLNYSIIKISNGSLDENNPYTFSEGNIVSHAGFKLVLGSITGQIIDIPDAPSNVSGNESNGNIILSWNAPNYDGGLPITDYKINYSLNSGLSWNTYVSEPDSSTTKTLTGLINGTYLFKVAAVNVAGTGLNSQQSSPIVLKTATPVTTQISSDGGVIYLKQQSSNSFMEYSSDNEHWTSISTNWPIQITNSNPIPSNKLTIEFNSNMVFSSNTIGTAISNAYIIIGSEFIDINGNDKTITLNGMVQFPGLFSNGSGGENGKSNVEINNIGIIWGSGTTLLQGGAYLCQQYWAKNTTDCVVNNCYAIASVNHHCAGLFGSYSSGIANYCYFNGFVDSYSSGLFGNNSTGTANHCYFSGSFTNDGAGIFGSYSSGTANYCYVTANKIGPYGGGIFGNNCLGTANYCYTVGPIQSNSGGIFGLSSTGIANYCYATGTIGSSAGGIFGKYCTGTASNCYSTGLLDVQAGGIFGEGCGGYAINCYSLSATIPSRAGGIYGYASGGTASNCYSIGLVTGTGTEAGSGIFGFTSSVTARVQNCYTTSVNLAISPNVTIENSFAQNGSWDDIEAIKYLTGCPTYNIIAGTNKIIEQGTIWIDPDTDCLSIAPFVLKMEPIITPTYSTNYIQPQTIPLIILQPKNYTSILGKNIQVKVIASGSKNQNKNFYQWYSNTLNSNVNGTELIGQNLSYLNISFTQENKNLYYYVEINGVNSTVKSDVIKILEAPEPTTSQFILPSNKIYGDSSFTFLNPTSNSTGDWVYTSSNPSIVTVIKTNLTTNTINILGAGSTIITATQAATNSYAEKQITIEFLVAPKKITVNAQNKTINYGSNLPTFDFNVVGIITSDTIQNVFNGNLETSGTSSSNPGVYGILQGTLSTKNNYQIETFNPGTLTINKKPLVIDVRNKAIQYGDLIPTFDFNVVGLASFDSIGGVFTGSLTVGSTNLNSGTYTISRGSLETNQNYIIETFNSGTLTISKKQLIITVNNKTIEYGDIIPTLDFSVNLDSIQNVFNGALVTSGTSSSNPGTYSILQGTLGTNSNYIIETFNSGTLTINKAQSVLNVFTISDRPYSNLTFTPNIKIIKGNQQIQYTSSDTSLAEISSSGVITMISASANNITITASVPDNTQYFGTTQSTTFKILKADSSLGGFIINNQAVQQNADSTYTPVTITPVDLPKIIIGEGLVSYTSNDNSIASVNSSTGQLTLKTPGTVTITASICVGNPRFNESIKSSTFTIIGIPPPPTYSTDETIKASERHGFLDTIFTQNSSTESFNLDKSKLGITDGPDSVLVAKPGATINVASSISSEQSAYINLNNSSDSVTLNVGTDNLIITKSANGNYKVNITGTTEYTFGQTVRMFGMLLRFGGLGIQSSPTVLTSSAGTILLRQQSNLLAVEYKINSGNWESIGTNWPIKIENTDNTNNLIVQLTTDIIINATTIGTDTNGFIELISNKVQIDGNQYTVTIDGVTNYKGFIKNGTGTNNTQNSDRFSNIQIVNLGILSSNNSSLSTETVQNAGWLTQSYWGDNTCTIDKCYSTGSIADGCGGLLGYRSTAIVTNSYSIGAIGVGAGGIFGLASINSSVTNSYSLGSIGDNAGGIYGSLSTGSATNCYSAGSLGTNADGIFGKDSTVTITNCYFASGSWLDLDATSSTGTNNLDTSTTPIYNSDNSIANSVGSIWLDQNLGLSNVPYILGVFEISLYTSNSLTLNYGQSGTSGSGSKSGRTYQLINNVSGITINTTTGVLSFSNSVKAGNYQLKILYWDTNKPYGYLIGTYTLLINKIPLTVTPVDNIKKRYGETIPTLNFNFYETTGLLSGESSQTALTGALTTSATSTSIVGTYPINIGNLSAENYTITFATKNFTIEPAILTVTPNPVTINYGDTIPTLTYTATGFVNSQTISVLTGSLSTSATNISVPENYPIVVGTLAAPNYTISLTSVNLVIQRKTLTVTPNSITINYGDAIPTLTYTATGFVNTQTISVLTGSLTTNATNTSVPGNYLITIGSLATTNYTINLTSVNLVIQSKPITISASAQTKKYTGLTHNLGSLLFTVTGMLSGQTIQSVTLSSTGVDASTTPYSILISSAVPGPNTNLSNYSITYQTGLLTIEKVVPSVGNFVIPNKKLSDVSFTIPTITKPVGHNGSWSYRSSDSSIALISGNTITLQGTGIVKITATLSADSNYLSLVSNTQFSVTGANEQPSTFSFIDTNTILTSIPLDIVPANNAISLSSLSDTIKQKMNPLSGTSEEKLFNRSLVVKSLFDIYNTISTIIIPKESIYLPSEISATITDVKLFNTTTSNTNNPATINTSSISQTDAFYCFMETGNAVVFNGTGAFSNYSIKIIKNATDYSIIKTENSNITNSTGAKNDIIEYAGLKLILGSVTGQLQTLQNMILGSVTGQLQTLQNMRTGGDPIIQPIFGPSFSLASHIKYVNLIADYTSHLFINAQVDMLSTNDFPKHIYWDGSFSETKKLTHIYSNSYYRKFRINYQEEIIEIDADTLDVNQITQINKIKIIRFKPKHGLKSISFNKTYPLLSTTKAVRIGFGNYLLNITSDIFTDDRHHLELINVKQIDLENTCGALICKEQIIRINDLTGKEVFNFKSNPFYEKNWKINNY